MKGNDRSEERALNAFINKKQEALITAERSFSSLYSLMFSEKDRIFFEESDGYRIKKTTYGQSKENAEQRAFSLKKALKEAPHGSVVGLFLNNGKEWVETFWAVLICGFKPLLLNMRLDDDTLEKALLDTKAAAVISEGKVFKERTLTLEDLALTGETYLSKDFGEEVLFMTSGTSDHVKICAYSEKELFSVLDNSFDIIKANKLIKKHYHGELKLLTFLPFYHIFGFVAVYFWFAYFARTFVALRDFAPDTIIDTIRRHKVTHLFAVPLFWQKVYDAAVKGIRQRGDKTYAKFQKGLKISKALGNSAMGKAFSRRAFKEIRENVFGESISFMISGGSIIQPHVLEFFNAIGYRLVNGYGMTEIGITSVELSDDRKVIDSCAIGKPFRTVEYKVEGGELYVKGSSRAKYTIEDGKVIPMPEWFRTGDLFTYADGNYRITGREDDLIVSVTGENLNPNLIENKFNIPRVKEVCLIGGKGLLPTLLIYVGKYLSSENFKELQALVSARIAELHLTSQIGKVAFTTTPLVKGDEIKLNRRRIAAAYGSGEFQLLEAGSDAADGEHDEIENKIREFFALSLNKEVDEVGFDTDFFLDEGGTSLDYMAMISQLSHEFGVDIPDLDGALTTVVSIGDYIKRNL